MEPLSRDGVGSALELIEADLETIEAIMFQASEGATSFLTDSATHLQRAGGKRIRPALTALCARLGRGLVDVVAKSAAAIEMTHLATLYHDDVIDEADLRRGVLSVNEKWGNKVAILAGDFLFARASRLAADVGGDLPKILADAITLVVQGQVTELEAAYDPGRTTEHYFATIKGKTAALLEASAHAGALLGGCSGDVIRAASAFGSSFGLAFQVADDLLDLMANEQELGKPPGTDLRDGVYTLPVLFALEEDESLRDALGSPDVDVDHVRKVVITTDAFHRALDFAVTQSQSALTFLEAIPNGRERSALEELTRLVTSRIPEP